MKIMNERNLTFNLLDPNQIRLTLCYTNFNLNTKTMKTHRFSLKIAVFVKNVDKTLNFGKIDEFVWQNAL